jgi:hypothetical protein
MKKQILDLLTLFVDQLAEILAEPIGLGRLNAVDKLSEKTIIELLEILKTNQFENEREEIEFYKISNPKILSPPIEEGLKYNVLTNTPISTNEVLIHYYEDAIKILQSFFSMNNFHYQYFKNNFVELDRVYFVANAESFSIPIFEIPAQIRKFCPPMSYLFAKFSAYENVQHFILTRIEELKIPFPGISMQNIPEDSPEIKWTGEVINVVELAYGLWLTGQLNNGNASLNQIVRWLEKNLSISIGIAQRKFTEIGRRKRISITKFIDQMKQAVLQKIDSDHK